MIFMIVAHSRNYVIGHNNKLPWKIKADLQFFHKLTVNKTVLMGRKTYLSIGKLLSNRKNIIVSKDKNFTIRGASIVSDLLATVSEYKKSGDDLYIIGGSSIYEQTLQQVDILIVSYIPVSYQGDCYFPKYESEFRLEKVEKMPQFEIRYYVRKGQ